MTFRRVIEETARQAQLAAIRLRNSELAKNGIIPSVNSDEYEIETEIGYGKYSRVFKCYDSKGEVVVLKILKPTNVRRIIREILILQNLSEGPCIIHFSTIVIQPGTESLALVFGYVDNEPNSKLYPKFTPNDVRYYLYQILRALDYCKSKGIMHRDVKPSNIMIDHSKRQLRLADWGLGEFYQPNTKYSVRVSSLNFKGPELLTGYVYYDYSLDMWCLGCVFAEMIFRKHPFFHGSDSITQMREIIRVLGHKEFDSYVNKYRMPYNLSINDGVKDCKAQAWSNFINNKNEKTATSDAIDLLGGMLKYDHSARLVPRTAMAHAYFDPIRKELEAEERAQGF